MAAEQMPLWSACSRTLADGSAQQSAGNRQSNKKSGLRRFLKNRTDRIVVRLQRVRHEVHAASKRIAELANDLNFSSIRSDIFISSPCATFTQQTK
jgi:hypothetical protein